MSCSYDVIVLGLGGMGSATAYQLALRQKRVLGVERFSSPHNQGSSHGQSRVIRQAYYEDSSYVPLLKRAYELWNQIERDSGVSLLSEVGGLMIGLPDGEVVSGSLESARNYDLKHEVLDAKEIRRRFPPIQPPAGAIALYEEKAGFVRPELSVKAHLDRAAALGAELHFEEEALSWEPVNDHVRVKTKKGVYEADRLVLAPGPWAPNLLRDLGVPLQVERQILCWFDPIGGVEPFLPERFPIFIYDVGDGATPYGFPSLDGPTGGVKIAFYRVPEPYLCTARDINRTVSHEEIDALRKAISVIIPSLNSACLQAVTCMYTNTPDKHFVLTLHPRCPHVSVACGFSGHGYKFCSVVGEIMADLAIEGRTRHDIGLFGLTR